MIEQILTIRYGFDRHIIVAEKTKTLNKGFASANVVLNVPFLLAEKQLFSSELFTNTYLIKNTKEFNSLLRSKSKSNIVSVDVSWNANLKLKSESLTGKVREYSSIIDIDFADCKSVSLDNKIIWKLKASKGNLINKITSNYSGHVCNHFSNSGHHKVIVLNDDGKYCYGLMVTSNLYWNKEKYVEISIEDKLSFGLVGDKEKTYLTLVKRKKNSLVPSGIIIPNNKLKELKGEFNV